MGQIISHRPVLLPTLNKISRPAISEKIAFLQVIHRLPVIREKFGCQLRSVFKEGRIATISGESDKRMEVVAY